jgi:hypothetical protein
MPERRREKRPDSNDRRSFPRPPLWLNIAILVLAVAILGFGKLHRERIDRQFADVAFASENVTDEIARIREELSRKDMNRAALRSELQARLDHVESLRSDAFYLAIDTEARKLRLYYGDRMVREADVTIGQPGIVRSGSHQWTFAPLRGAFHVQKKATNPPWRVPDWVYTSRGEPVPEQRPVIAGGLGRYVIELPNDYVIHSPPPEESPLGGAKPASFMVPEEDLRAIWPRVNEEMRVYVF